MQCKQTIKAQHLVFGISISVHMRHYRANALEAIGKHIVQFDKAYSRL